jgi:hypothetical protein
VTNRAIAHARLRSSRLTGAHAALPTARDVVRWFGAVQSQDVPGAMWAVAQRMPPGTTLEDVGQEFDAGDIVRTHAMRPTWHFLAPDELRWIQELTGPRVRAANSAINRRALQLTDEEFAIAERVLRAELAGGRIRTRDELREPWTDAGVAIREPLALAYLAMDAELRAVICSGPRRGRQATTYALVDERIPPTPPRDRDDALRDLTIRYFTSHGPALVQDMSWWSGLTVTDIRHGIELAGDALEGRTVDDKAYWSAAGAFDPPDVPEPFVRLLSNYDEYLGSYTDYDPIFDPALPKARNVADVLGAHIVVRDGFVVGGWRRALGRDRVGVNVTLLIPLTAVEMVALEEQAAAFGRFFGLPADLVVTSAA